LFAVYFLLTDQCQLEKYALEKKGQEEVFLLIQI